MKRLLITCLFTATLAAAQPRELALCARIGVLRSNQGSPLVFGHHRAPKFWGWARDVHYQVCTPEGRPVLGQRHLDLVIEPLTEILAEQVPATREVTTDEYGRFSASYGGGGRSPGPAWPEGVVSVELHHFLLDGRTIASFVLERSAADLRFYRR